MADQSDLEQLGQFVRQRRQELGLTQTQVGNRLGWAQERVSLLENGKYGMPALPQLARLSDALGLDIMELLRHTGIGELQTPQRNTQTARVQITGLRERMRTMVEAMEGVETRLHDAERQLQCAEVLLTSLQSRRQQMAELLASCRQ